MNEVFQVQDHSSLHKYYTQIPNIIFDLGLSASEFQLYCLYKRIAGDGGGCWKTTKHLAAHLNLTPRTVQALKKRLCQPRPELGGIALIVITPRFKKDTRERETDLVVLMDVWEINFQKISTSGNKRQGGTEINDRGVRKKTAGEEEPIEEEPIKEKRKKDTLPSSLSSFSKKSEKKLERALHVSTTKEEHQKLVAKYGATKVQEAYNYLSEWKEDTSQNKWKKSDAKSIERWVMDALHEQQIKIKKRSESGRETDNICWAKTIANNYNLFMGPHKQVRIEAFKTQFEMFSMDPTTATIPATIIPYTAKGFKEQVENALRKWGLK